MRKKHPQIFVELAANDFRLSGNVTAQKLAHVDKAGEGESEVDLFHPQPGVFSKMFVQVEVTWNELKRSCMVFLRPRFSIFTKLIFSNDP